MYYIILTEERGTAKFSTSLNFPEAGNLLVFSKGESILQKLTIILILLYNLFKKTVSRLCIILS
jgi:hypothetical protein